MLQTTEPDVKSQDALDRQFSEIYATRRNIIKQCNSYAKTVQSEQDFWGRKDIYEEQIKAQEERYAAIVDETFRDKSKRIWVPGDELDHQKLKVKLLRILREHINDADAGGLRANDRQERGRTTGRLEGNPLRDFVHEEFIYYLEHTTRFAQGTSENFKKQFRSDAAKLLTVEAGIRLIVKANENHKIYGKTTTIHNTTEKRIAGLFCADSDTGFATGNISKNGGYVAQRSNTHAGGSIHLATLDKYSTWTVTRTTDGTWVPAIIPWECKLAHEELHHKHRIQGKSMRMQPFRNWHKLSVGTVRYFFRNPEELVTTNTEVFGVVDPDKTIRLSESVISVELGGSYESVYRHARELDIMQECSFLNGYFGLIDAFDNDAKFPEIYRHPLDETTVIDFSWCDLKKLWQNQKAQDHLIRLIRTVTEARQNGADIKLRFVGTKMDGNVRKLLDDNGIILPTSNPSKFWSIVLAFFPNFRSYSIADGYVSFSPIPKALNQTEPTIDLVPAASAPPANQEPTSTPILTSYTH
jgi:hypothetical protein